MGIGPKSDEPNNSNIIVKEESLDELAKRLEEVALERSIRQEGSRPASVKHGLEDSLDTPIDLTKNDDDPQGKFQ